MAKEENLIPNEKRTPTERRQNAQKAGIASGVARRKKKRMKELCDLVLSNKIQDKNTIENLKQRFPELDVEDATYELMLILKQYEKAKDGDAKAFEILRDTSNQKPVEKQQITNIDADGYRRILMGDEDIFAGDYGSADEDEEETEE